MRGVQAGGLSKEATDKVCKMHDRWLIRAIAAEAKVAAVERLLRVDDYDPYVHANEGCQGEPDCARCWADDIRAALATEVQS